MSTDAQPVPSHPEAPKLYAVPKPTVKPKKRRGRPKGSGNKAKAPRTEEECWRQFGEILATVRGLRADQAVDEIREKVANGNLTEVLTVDPQAIAKGIANKAATIIKGELGIASGQG